jgi:hypothetical protein
MEVELICHSSRIFYLLSYSQYLAYNIIQVSSCRFCLQNILVDQLLSAMLNHRMPCLLYLVWQALVFNMQIFIGNIYTLKLNYFGSFIFQIMTY